MSPVRSAPKAKAITSPLHPPSASSVPSILSAPFASVMSVEGLVGVGSGLGSAVAMDCAEVERDQDQANHDMDLETSLDENGEYASVCEVKEEVASAQITENLVYDVVSGMVNDVVDGCTDDEVFPPSLSRTLWSGSLVPLGIVSKDANLILDYLEGEDNPFQEEVPIYTIEGVEEETVLPTVLVRNASWFEVRHPEFYLKVKYTNHRLPVLGVVHGHTVNMRYVVNNGTLTIWSVSKKYPFRLCYYIGHFVRKH